MNIVKFIIILVVMVAIMNSLVNLRKWLKLQKLKLGYEKYLEQNPPSYIFHEKKQEIIDLFINAGLREPQVPYVQMVNPMYVDRGHTGVFDNMMVLKPEIISAMHSLFLQAIGVYKIRTLDSINPLYWIEVILTLFKKINLTKLFSGLLSFFRLFIRN